MSSNWSLDSRFKRTEIVRFPEAKDTRSKEALYWKNLQFPVTVQEFGPISRIDICKESPNYVAVTGSTRVQIFNPATNQVHKTLTKFRGGAYGGRFRKDGRLLCVGGEANVGSGEAGALVMVFDVTTKNLLRLLKGKNNSSGAALSRNQVRKSATTGNDSLATHCCDFTADMKHIAGFSDDKSVRIWDITTEEQVATWENHHKDYVRAGCVSDTHSDIVMSGSYDHTVKLWDKRQPDKFTTNFDHGCPVESICLLPNGSLLASAGGHEIRIWDLLAGKLLTAISPHNKTITSLGIASNGTRLVSASLDRQVKFHEIATYQTVHSISFPSPVLTAAVASDDSVVCAGMSDGLVQFLHRKDTPDVMNDDTDRTTRNRATSKGIQHRYMQFTHFEPQSGDVVVKQMKNPKELRHDHFLRKFEYTKALDQVLKPYVQRKFPEYTFSVLMELNRRNGLKTALGGRDEKSLTLLLNYLCKYVNDPRFSYFLMYIVDQTLDLYATSIGNCPATDKLFVDLRKRLHRETQNLATLMELQGALDMILTASHTSDPPELRCEEKAFKRHLQKEKYRNSEIMKERLTAPSDTVLSWEKTLIHSVL